MPCFLITIPYTHLDVKVFIFILHSCEIKKITRRLLLTTPRVFIWGLTFTVMLLTSDHNEHVWCLHQAVLPYFLSLLSVMWDTNKNFQLTSNLGRGVKLIYVLADVICGWSLINKNELEFTLDQSNSKRYSVISMIHKPILFQIAR